MQRYFLYLFKTVPFRRKKMRVRKGWNVFTRVGNTWFFAKNGNFSNEVKTKLSDSEISDILDSFTGFGLSEEAAKYF